MKGLYLSLSHFPLQPGQLIHLASHNKVSCKYEELDLSFFTLFFIFVAWFFLTFSNIQRNSLETSVSILESAKKNLFFIYVECDKQIISDNIKEVLHKSNLVCLWCWKNHKRFCQWIKTRLIFMKYRLLATTYIVKYELLFTFGIMNDTYICW